MKQHNTPQKSIFRSGSQQGFTLVEALIAAAVFSFGALGLLSLMVYSAETNRVSQSILIATTLANTKLEELKFTPYDQIVAGTEAKNIDAVGELVSSSDYRDQDGLYARKWEVTEKTSVSNHKYKEIIVTVEWFDRQAQGNDEMGTWRSIKISGGVNKP